MAAVRVGGTITHNEHTEGILGRRRLEFRAGREAARRAIVALSPQLPTRVAKGPGGEPLWPSGLVGSITHTADLAAAAVARAERIRGIGIDSERVLDPDLAREVQGLICSSAELTSGLALVDDTLVGLTLAFSAKESLFKCLAPSVGRYFDFLDAAIVDVSRGTFRIQLVRALLPELQQGWSVQGRFEVLDGIVHTGICWPRA